MLNLTTKKHLLNINASSHNAKCCCFFKCLKWRKWKTCCNQYLWKKQKATRSLKEWLIWFTYDKRWNTKAENVKNWCWHSCVESERWVGRIIFGMCYFWIVTREILFPDWKCCGPPAYRDKHDIKYGIESYLFDESPSLCSPYTEHNI